MSVFDDEFWEGYEQARIQSENEHFKYEDDAEMDLTMEFHENGLSNF